MSLKLQKKLSFDQSKDQVVQKCNYYYKFKKHKKEKFDDAVDNKLK